MTFIEGDNTARIQTAKVIRGGQVRLSADTIIAKRFRPIVVFRQRAIMLMPDVKGKCKVVFTNSRARSGRIALGAELKRMGFRQLAKIQGREMKAKAYGGSVWIYVDKTL